MILFYPQFAESTCLYSTFCKRINYSTWTQPKDIYTYVYCSSSHGDSIVIPLTEALLQVQYTIQEEGGKGVSGTLTAPGNHNDHSSYTNDQICISPRSL